LAAIVVTVLLLLEPAAVLQAMERSLRLCARTVIPALFPYLVASELLVASGAGERVAVLFSRPIQWLYGVSRCGAVVYGMGLLCGFPIAARTAAAYVAAGKMTPQEQRYLMCFANVPSAAFLINAVGVTLYGSAAFGRQLWLVSVVSAAVVGLLLRPFYGRPARMNQSGASPARALSLGGAPVRAAGGMLAVVATVLFFGSLLGALQALLGRLIAAGYLPLTKGAGALLMVILSSLLELTGGTAASASLLQSGDALLRALSPLACAAAVGWGGMSIHVQLFTAGEASATLRPFGAFWISRLLQALFCALGILLLRGGAIS
jgi:hypothetical protein